MRVIVTRPDPECRQWVRSLVGHGLDAVALPLIALGVANDDANVRDCWNRLAQYNAVMFVSGAAALHFFSRRPAPDPALQVGGSAAPRFWATGPGTVMALLRQDVDPGSIDAPDADSGQFDSEALWRLVGGRVQRGQRVLIVRGTDDPAGTAAQGSGRDWLASMLEQSGVAVDHVVVYQRNAPRWSPADQRLARAAALDGSVWLFTSSQALANLAVCVPDQSWVGARALVTHARIGQAAREAGFGVVWESRPRIEDVVASIESAL